MMNMFRRMTVFVLIAALMWVAVPPERSFACSCAEFTTLEAKDHADEVFRGTVTDIKQPWMPNSMLARVTMQVDEVWKGEAEQVVLVYSSLFDASCGVEFEVGKTFLVFANYSDGVLKTSMCSRTEEVTYAGQELRDLGPGLIESKQIELKKSAEAGQQAAAEKRTAAEKKTELYTPLWFAIGVTALIWAALWLFGRRGRV